MNQRIEDVRTFAGQTATVSLWMKTSQAQTVRLRVDQNFGTGGSPSSIVYSSTQDCSVTTSWQKFTKTFSVASISGKTIGTAGLEKHSGQTSYLALAIGSLGATSIASQSVDIAQVQFELGSSATPFERRSYGEELAMCQRYFNFIDDTYQSSTHCNSTTNNGRASMVIDWPVTMRVDPTVTFTDGGGNVGKATYHSGNLGNGGNENLGLYYWSQFLTHCIFVTDAYTGYDFYITDIKADAEFN